MPETLILQEQHTVGSIYKSKYHADTTYLVTACTWKDAPDPDFVDEQGQEPIPFRRWESTCVSIAPGQACMYLFKSGGKERLVHCKILEIIGSSLKIEYDHPNRDSSYPHTRTLTSNTERARLSLLNVPVREPTKSEKWARQMAELERAHDEENYGNISVIFGESREKEEDEQQSCEVCGKETTDALSRVEVDIDGQRSWHYACSKECLQQIEDVVREKD